MAFGETSGERHLGAVIGSPEFRSEYICNEIEIWVQEVIQLAEIAENEPQLVHSAFTKALSMRWCFLQKTIAKGSIPKDSIPKGSIPKGSIPKGSIPKGFIPKGFNPTARHTWKCV